VPNVSLHTIAPRLARARDGWLAERHAISVERRRLNEVELHKRWLVDHRDLQLQRAQAAPGVSVGKRRSWIAARQRKLAEARDELADVLAAQAALDDRERRLSL